jgi:hypothetical protein
MMNVPTKGTIRAGWLDDNDNPVHSDQTFTSADEAERWLVANGIDGWAEIAEIVDSLAR